MRLPVLFFSRSSDPENMLCDAIYIYRICGQYTECDIETRNLNHLELFIDIFIVFGFPASLFTEWNTIEKRVPSGDTLLGLRIVFLGNRPTVWNLWCQGEARPICNVAK